jgi:hypothetical protein
MNERIEELYKQSFIEVQDENSFPCMTFSKQKFAELIVRECSRIGEMKEQGSSEYDPNMSVGWYMRKHFGVEE